MSGHQIYKDNNACSQNPQRQQCPEDSKIFKIIRTRMSSNYKNKNVLKFTRAMVFSNLQGQQCPQYLQGQRCPQYYEVKHVLNSQGQQCPQDYEDNNVLKIMRTNMSSKFTRTTMFSDKYVLKIYKDSNVLKITRTKISSKFTRTAMSSRLRGQKCPQNLQGQQCPQDYEDKNLLKIYKDNNALKIMRTKMSSNLLRQ
ncbi:unnamed protein product [Rhizophagus irregularis]|nr:unnamed protein product [Rhizophagus irregularis]